MRPYIFIMLFFLLADNLVGQSFYREKNPKTISYQVGLGAGTFFSAPRPSYDSIVNQRLPVLSLALGKRIGSHLNLKSTFSFQPYSSKEFIPNPSDNSSTLSPIFNGYNYAFDFMPSFNLIPSYHHMSRPVVDFNLGIGAGFLLTYRTEKLFFNEKYYEFNLFESSVYIPIRASLSFRFGMVSDLILEGTFLNTFLDENRSLGEIKKNSDHFAQLIVAYRRFIR